MAWVARGTMSDRREDLSTTNVKCYIYNSKTNIPEPTIITTPTVPVLTPQTPVGTPTVKPDPVITPTPVVHPVAPVVTVPIPAVKVDPLPKETTPPAVTPTPVVVPPLVQTGVNKKISLTLDNLSDIAQHFITQNDLVITLVAKSPLKLGEVATLTLEIKNKKTGEPYSGLLPFSFTLLSTNSVLQSNTTNIKLINN